MLRFFFAAMAFCYSAAAHSKDSTLENVFYYTNESVKICKGPTEVVHLPEVRGEPYFLKYYNGENRSETYLTIVIWGSDIQDLEINPVSYFSSQDRCMTGVVSNYKGKKQIVIRSQDQLINK